MTPSENDLLNDALFRLEGGDSAFATLPGVLAALSRGQPLVLSTVQAHQQHAQHAFMVQLAALSLVRAGRSTIAHDETAWREMLLGAAAEDGGGPETYCLVVDDPGQPAFMQPPLGGGRLADLKNEHVRPSEELDVLITAKNHDVKVHGITAPRPEHWVYALITLQTMQGFLGAGNYGISRMNGGFSSRPCVAFAPGVEWGERFVRDVRALLAAREQLLDKGFRVKGGVGLVWCKPWDGTSSLAFEDLDPFFIEVCRRVRLKRTAEARIIAHRGSSKAPRIAGGERSGNTGDPWTPVSTEDGKALTMSEAGFHYERVRDLLLGELWAHGAAGKPSEGDKLWLGQVFVRGQGKTGGYHERWLPIPEKARSFLTEPSARDRMATRATDWVALAGDMRLKVLKPAILCLLQGGPEKLKFDDDRAGHALQRFGDEVDRRFFPMLFEQIDQPVDVAGAHFEKTLFDIARSELERAITSFPGSTARQPRAVAFAERALHGAARKLLKRAFPPTIVEQEGAKT